jgi:hypothetical protein
VTPARALLTWLLLFAVAFANGALREFTYRRTLGEALANQVSCGIGIAAIWAAVWAIGGHWRFTSAAQAWRIGALWLVMTVAWEFLFFHYVMEHPWDELLANYAIWRGRLWVLVLAGILTAPLAAFHLNSKG